MIPKECKRLAEVDFPIAVVSKHAARERSIRHGHPSTLHLWWARRPLASCRAMLLGLLLPDPCDEHCPAGFREKARELLSKVQGNTGSSDLDLRKAFLKFIGDFSNWDLSIDQTYLDVGRGLVKAANPGETPLVVDPFAGGGSIPLEALRLGCEVFASDLNPVACLILKVMLEDIPRHGPWLADELKRVGAEIKKEAEEKLAEFYPKDPDGVTPIAYLWTRTVKCESPNCGAEIPLARSFWLCNSADHRRGLGYKVIRPSAQPPRVEFEIIEPKPGQEIAPGNISNGKATCLACGTVLSAERVRAQITHQRGKTDVIFDAKGNRIGGARMLVIVSLHKNSRGRQYRLPTDNDYHAVWVAQKRMELLVDEWVNAGKVGLCPLPDEPINPLRPSANARGLSAVTRYGARAFGDLFTMRQTLALTLLGQVIRKSGVPPLVLGKVIRHCNAFAFWHKGSETVAGAFGRHALPMSWDFPEFYPLSDFAGGIENALGDLLDSVSHIACVGGRANQVLLADATNHPLPSDSAMIWFTDPPYYDAIPYSDLSDFFFVWLKRMMPGDPMLRDPYDSANPLTPKAAEVVQSQKDRDISGRVKDRAYYEDAMAKAFSEGRRVLKEDGIASVVFAHKTTEGWEALLSGIVRGGWTVTGSWPIATERGARLLARDTAALATSVHLICRPRSDKAPIGDWNEVLHGNKEKNLEGLTQRVADWMERLQGEGIRGADLVFACIGPALEIFSRYSKVETADGREVKLAEYLEKVWEVVGRTALEQVLGTAEAQARNGAASALEEDARLTALFLWTLQSTNGQNGLAKETKVDEEEVSAEDEEEEEETSVKGKKTKGYSLIFDVVRRFAQPLGIDLPKWEGRIIETKKGVVRLLSVSERAEQLFGKNGTTAVATHLERETKPDLQLLLFPVPEQAPNIRGRKKKIMKISSEAELTSAHEATTLDRVHAAMLLQSSGRANALRALIGAEQDRGPEFLRLANALSALYPQNSEEKRLLDAMLLAVPR